MKTTHVNDIDIQKFTFDLSECETIVIEHIHSCKECKTRAESYLLLANTIKEQPGPILEFNITELVFDKLPLSSKQNSVYNYFIYFLIMVSIAVVASVLYFFRETLLGLFSDTTAISISFIISVAMLIAFALSLDLVKSFNKKINMLNYS